jgi:hypothetical protein
VGGIRARSVDSETYVHMWRLALAPRLRLPRGCVVRQHWHCVVRGTCAPPVLYTYMIAIYIYIGVFYRTTCDDSTRSGHHKPSPAARTGQAQSLGQDLWRVTGKPTSALPAKTAASERVPKPQKPPL